MEKKYLRCVTFFICLMIFLFENPSIADAADEKPQVVRVGFFAFDGYHVQDKNGNRSGYGYDFLQMVSRYENITYEYVGYDKTWADMLDMLENGEIDLLTSALMTEERLEKYDFSRRQIGTSATILTVRSGDTSIVSGEYDTYQGIRVGILKDETSGRSFTEFAGTHQFTYTQVYFDTEQELTDALANGEVDAAVTGSPRVLGKEWILETFQESGFYAIVKKGNEDLLEQVNEAIERMDQDSPEWRRNLQEKYFKGNSGEELFLTAEEEEFRKELAGEERIFQVAVNPDRYPYSYFENGAAKGMMPELFQEIARRAGIKYQVMETPDRSAYRKLLKSGKADICIDCADDWNAAERLGYKITDSYLTAGFSWVQRKDFAGEMRTVAALDKTAAPTMEMPGTVGNKKVDYYDSVGECLDAVRDGKADAYYTFTYQAERFVFDDVRNELATAQTPYYENFNIGVADTIDSRLVTILNKGVKSLDHYYVDEVIKRNTDFGEHAFSFRRLFYEYPALIALMVGCLAVIVFFLFFVVIQRKYRLKLKHALADAKAANRAKTEFLANMSHDIRTPMNAIIGLTSIAQMQGEDREKVKRCLKKIKTASGYLLSIINEVLDMSAVERGKMELQEEPFRLCEQMESVLSISEQQGKEKSLEFQVDMSGIEHEEVFGDYYHLNRVLSNLISNAVKFTKPGGKIWVTAREKESSKEGYASYELKVVDNGIGMSREFMQRIYNPFERERSSTVSQVEGTGLGLAITKSIMELLGGDIQIESEQGKGTAVTVLFSLKLREEGEAQEQEQETTVSPEESLHYENKHILLVEDNEVNREIASYLLEDLGLTVEYAEDGLRAVEKMKAARPNTYDLIFMDIMMPRMDGYEAVRQIRSLAGEYARTVPIIAMTANAFAEDRKRALDAGMNEHLAKPIETGQLYVLLGKYLGAGEKEE